MDVERMKKLNLLYMVFLIPIFGLTNFSYTTVTNLDQINMSEIIHKLKTVSLGSFNSDLLTIIFGGIGGSLGGAFFGSLMSSHFQTKNTKQYESEKKHHEDLKQVIVEKILPIVSISSIRSSTILDVPDLFVIYQIENELHIKSNHILYSDLIKNHYPNIYLDIITLRKLHLSGMDIYNKIFIEIHNRIKLLLETFNEQDKDIHKEYDWIDILINTKLIQIYHDSFFRTTPYANTIYVYFSELKDDGKIVDYKKYVVAQFTKEDIDDNIEMSRELISLLKAEVNKIDISEVMKEYSRIVDEFDKQKENLMTSLLEMKYSTKLRFSGKCPFL